MPSLRVRGAGPRGVKCNGARPLDDGVLRLKRACSPARGPAAAPPSPTAEFLERERRESREPAVAGEEREAGDENELGFQVPIATLRFLSAEKIA